MPRVRNFEAIEASIGHNLLQRMPELSQWTNFDFEVVRDAYTWWNFRNAYLLDTADMKRASEGPKFDEEGHKHVVAQQMICGYNLFEGNPAYVYFFARLQQLKHIDPHGREAAADPLKWERTMAYEALCNIIDKEVEQNGSPGHNNALTFSGVNLYSDVLQPYTLSRREAGNGHNYAITIHEPLEERMDGANDLYDTAIRHHLLRGPESILQYGTDKMDTTLALDIAGLIVRLDPDSQLPLMPIE